ncbi:MAG: hypothetical protein ACYCX1_05345 [Bellilinea sp.]
MSICLLCNLAKSNPQKRMLIDFPALLAFTRYDICQSLKNTYDVVRDEAVKETALRLIETETDLKYRKKYAGLWKGKA